MGAGRFCLLHLPARQQERQARRAWRLQLGRLREAQSLTLSVPNTGEAVLIDLGDSVNIHPRNKKDVGARSPRSLSPGPMDTRSSAPARLSVDEDRRRQDPPHLQRAGGRTSSPSLCRRPTASIPRRSESSDRAQQLVRAGGFAICGEDRKWTWADAKIEGGEVVVSSAQVPSRSPCATPGRAIRLATFTMSRASRLALPHGRFPDHHSVPQILSSGSTPLLPDEKPVRSCYLFPRRPRRA